MIERTGSSTRTRSTLSALFGNFPRPWNNELLDERQQAIINQAYARSLYLMFVLIMVASGIFQLIDAKRFGPSVDIFVVIALGGMTFAGRTARRQGVRPATGAVSWRAIFLGSALFGVLFYFTMARSGEKAGPVSSVLVAVIWGLMMKLALHWKRQSDLEREHQSDLQADEETGQSLQR